MDWEAIADESVELFKGLLKLDTTNPPGNEEIATEYLADQLADDGLDPWVVESPEGRSNLVVRLPATVDEPVGGPLLLAGHTDVVPANAEEWTHPPFDAVEADGCIWGRGAVDMKNMVSMSVMVAKLMARDDLPRNRDLIVACVADEEMGCENGSKFLVDEHPERVRAEYALGEVGGFWFHVGDITYVPIMLAERGKVRLRMTASGKPGHGSMPHNDNALVHLSRAVARLGEKKLPHHLCATMEGFLTTIAETQKLPERVVLPRLAKPRLAELLLDHVLPEELARTFNAFLHNTVAPTIVRAGTNVNVISSSATCELDGRTLPGFSAGDLVSEMRDVIDDDEIDIDVVSETPPVEVTDYATPLFRQIERAVAKSNPELVVTPYLCPGQTDGQYFSRLGATFYGFSPLMLPRSAEIKFADMFHGIDERVPRDGYLWGQRMLFDVVTEFLKP